MRVRAIAGFGLVAILMASPATATADVASVGTSPIVLINEFAPSGSDSTDEFLELRNTSHEVVSLAGWQLYMCSSPGSELLTTVFGDTLIPAEGRLLVAHINFNGPPPDHSYGGLDAPDTGGWLLIDTYGLADGVGLSQGLTCTEGDPAPQCAWAAGEAVIREQEDQSIDTDDNAADFTCRARTPGR